MELVAILRVLWRRRLVVGAGALLALILALNGAYTVSFSSPVLRSRATTTGVAAETAFVNTSQSLVANAYAKGAESVVQRAGLLGNLLASQPARAALASRLGVAASEVEVAAPGVGFPPVTTTLAEQATEVSRPGSPYVVTLSEDLTLPILTLVAAAPDERRASALVHASIAELASLGARTPALGRNLEVERVGIGSVYSKTSGGSKVKAVLVAFFFFVLWCVGVAAFDAFSRRRRRASGVASWRAAGA